MRILMVTEKEGSAIWRLAQGVKKYSQLHIDVIAVHPKRPDQEQLLKFVELAQKADIISFEYWKTYIKLRELYPELIDKKKMLAHYNPYNLYEENWNEFNLITVPNKTMKEAMRRNKKVKYVPLTIDAEKFPFNREYTDSNTVLMVSSRIEAKKGVLEVAEVCKELGYKFLLIGSISDKDYFNKIMAIGCEFRDKVTDEELLKAYQESAVHICNSIDDYESGCYDDKTEILTDNGWKLFKDLNQMEKVATLNPYNDALEFQKPYEYIEQDNWRELCTFSNRSIDYAVTPNHNMWVATATTKNRKLKYKDWRFVKADELPTNFKIKRNCNWNGKSDKDINWFRFLGIYLAEGSVQQGSKNSYRITLTAIKKQERKDIKRLLDDMEFKYETYDYCYRIGRQNKLAEYLKQFGTATEKYIPKEILNASPAQINEFLIWFCKGDGRIYNGARIMYTNSKKMVDNLQECFIKIGNNANISVRDRRGAKNWICNHWVTVKNLEYIIYEKIIKRDAYIRKNEKYGYEVKPYNGKVYCVEVKNHILLIRRNGKTMFCGNTMPILEAMLVGCPVLTRNVGHVPDLYDGKNMVVRKGDPEDKEDLKNELRKLMENKSKRLELRDNGWNTAKSRDDVRRAREYEKMWYSMMYNAPLVSVIIPTFNRKETLIQIIESVIEQDYPAIELIIADDGSTDGTKELIKHIQDRTCYPIKYLNTGTPDIYNLGLARNLGIIEAVGEIIVLLDDRYKLDSHCISRFTEKLFHKVWLYGDKGTGKRNFVENFSCIYRDDLIKAGMFNTTIKLYGFLTQETRERFKSQGLEFKYVPESQAETIEGSKAKYRKKDEIRQAKNILSKMDF